MLAVPFVLALSSLISTGDWQIWAPRPEIAPAGKRDGKLLVLQSGSNNAVWGGWQATASGIAPGSWYRITARYRTSTRMNDEPLHVMARIDWLAAGDKRVGQPDYATVTRRDGEWAVVSTDAPAPAEAVSARIQLMIANQPNATVAWEPATLERIEAPKPRKVRVAAVNLRPRRMATPADSVREFIRLVDAEVRDADLIVLPEGIVVVGNSTKYADAAETLPGPTTRALGELARRKKAWVVAGLYERDGAVLYNTSVLLDREGRLAGKYRKVYLPREEFEGGLTPGNSYPVFQTDFGKLGMMICWDIQYPDPARALALAGAEIIAVPIWGGSTLLGRARALENHVFVVSSGYDYPTEIVDPVGEVVAAAAPMPAIAQAEIDLNRRYTEKWLGYMRDRFRHEIRHDVPVRAQD